MDPLNRLNGFADLSLIERRRNQPVEREPLPPAHRAPSMNAPASLNARAPMRPPGGSLPPRAGVLPGQAAPAEPASWQATLAHLARLPPHRQGQALVAAAGQWPLLALQALESRAPEIRPHRLFIAKAILDHAGDAQAGSVTRRLLEAMPDVGPPALPVLAKPMIEAMGLSPMEVLQRLQVDPRNGLRGLNLHFQVGGQPALVVFGKALLAAHGDSRMDASTMNQLCDTLANSRMPRPDRADLAAAIAERPDGTPILRRLPDMDLPEAQLQMLAEKVGEHGPLGSQAENVLIHLPEDLSVALLKGQLRHAVHEAAQTGSWRWTYIDAYTMRMHHAPVLFDSALRDAARHPALQQDRPAARKALEQQLFLGVMQVAESQPEAHKREVMHNLQPPPAFVDAFERASLEPKLQVRAQRQMWALDAAFHFSGLPAAELDTLTPDLAFLEARRGPELRRQLTHTLAWNVRAEAAPGDYAAFAAQFEKAHMRGFAIALFDLYRRAGATPSAELLACLAHPQVKNAAVLTPMLEALLTMSSSTALPAADVCRLLHLAAHTPGNSRERSAKFNENLQMLSVALQALNHHEVPELRDKLLQLAQAAPGTDLAAALRLPLAQLMPGNDISGARLEDPATLARVYQNRTTLPLLGYTQALRGAAAEPRVDGSGVDAASALEALNRFADAALWSRQPAVDFARLRFDPDASPHLQHLHQHAPQAYQAWQQDLPEVSTPELEGRKVVDTADATALLMCGTDVTGSCQSLHGDIDQNVALMGFVIDGKYRMLALQNEDGSTHARRMLRLMVEAETGKPVLLMEGLYANAGVKRGGPEDQVLVDMARAKAQALGCVLLCDADDGDLAGPEHPRDVESLGSPAPYEYVDADWQQLCDGPYSVTACKVKEAP